MLRLALLLGLRLRWAPAARRAAHRRPADLTAMGNLIRPALPVPPAVLVAAFGIGLPAARSGSSHGSLLVRSLGFLDTMPWSTQRWHPYDMAKEIDRVRAQSALAVIKQHPGMVLFARFARDRGAGRGVVVVRRGLGGAAAGRDGARRRRRGPDEAQLGARRDLSCSLCGESRPISACNGVIM